MGHKETFPLLPHTLLYRQQIQEGEHMGKDIDDLIFGNAEPVPSER